MVSPDHSHVVPRSLSQPDEAELEDGPTQTFSRNASAQVLDAALAFVQRLRSPRMPHAVTLSPPPPGTALTWVAAALTALAIGSGTYIAVASGRPAPPAVESRAAELLPVPSVTDEPSVGQAEPAKRRPPPNKRPSRRARRVRSDGGDDARQLFAAEMALKLGKPRLALDLVNEHAQKYPRSGLVSERAALRAQILCDIGRTKAARRVVLELEAAEASGELLASVDQACTH